jgi:predicted ATP-dependent endonuclease of OLD family
MILKKVVVSNFLSILGTVEIDIDRNATILLGANDHGKSNLLSAVMCLNSETPITDDEVNWDAGSEPTSVVFELSLSDEEALALVEIIREEYPAIEESQIDSERKEDDGEDEDEHEDDDVQPDPIRPRMLELLPGLLKRPAIIKISRVGVDEPRMFEGSDLAELPEAISDFFSEHLPRVELFQAFSGELQDSVTAEQISTERFEFLQGIFFYAGLDPLNSKKIFIQDDKSERQLDQASKTLDAELRRLWEQGVDLNLHFELRHRQGSIEFLANDPAVRARKARMSKRSTGVTQFFRLSMLLHARRKKHPANAYVYLFDEPGVFLHPKGQKDLMQVFEQISGEAQVIYATHSLFMLNQNFPERHRLIIRDATGTKVDQKPYRANWRLATDALGVHLTANILFSSKVLLVEGDSDPLYIYEMLRQLNQSGELDADTNMLGILSYGDLPNLRFLLQVLQPDNTATKVAVLCDGDRPGRMMSQRIAALCKRLNVPQISLGEEKSIEDYILCEGAFISSVTETLSKACEAELQPVPPDIDKQVQQSWKEHKKQNERNTGRWFKDFSREVLGGQNDASKVALARNYVFRCRSGYKIDPKEKRVEAVKLIENLVSELAIPGIKAKNELIKA